LLELYKFWENLTQILKRHMDNWVVGSHMASKVTFGHCWLKQTKLKWKLKMFCHKIVMATKSNNVILLKCLSL
jgi:hypothetical protein